MILSSFSQFEHGCKAPSQPKSVERYFLFLSMRKESCSATLGLQLVIDLKTVTEVLYF